MSESLKLISPIDGSVYAERPVARDADIEAARSSARGALAEWKTVPVPSGRATCSPFSTRSSP